MGTLDLIDCRGLLAIACSLPFDRYSSPRAIRHRVRSRGSHTGLCRMWSPKNDAPTGPSTAFGSKRWKPTFTPIAYASRIKKKRSAPLKESAPRLKLTCAEIAIMAESASIFCKRNSCHFSHHISPKCLIHSKV